jgi:hypothetical protein
MVKPTDDFSGCMVVDIHQQAKTVLIAAKNC